MQACAFVVGPGDGRGAALRSLARQVGFEAVYPYRDIADAERQSASSPLIFFLFAAVDRLGKLTRVGEAVRQSQSQRVRFAPMIYFAETPSLDTIRACINIGFDDIITLPVALSRVEERLERQLYRAVTYYETPTYFGPDRRNRLGHESHGHSGRGTGGQYRRLELVRNPGAGIEILRDDTHVMV
jgi:hypothetical protein